MHLIQQPPLQETRHHFCPLLVVEANFEIKANLTVWARKKSSACVGI